MQPHTLPTFSQANTKATFDEPDIAQEFACILASFDFEYSSLRLRSPIFPYPTFYCHLLTWEGIRTITPEQSNIRPGLPVQAHHGVHIKKYPHLSKAPKVPIPSLQMLRVSTLARIEYAGVAGQGFLVLFVVLTSSFLATLLLHPIPLLVTSFSRMLMQLCCFVDDRLVILACPLGDRRSPALCSLVAQKLPRYARLNVRVKRRQVEVCDMLPEVGNVFKKTSDQPSS